MAAIRLIAKLALVLVTLLLLASIGGAMAVGVWVVVPLHWWASARAGPVATGGWALLAAASVGEAGWIYAYALVGESLAVAIVPIALFLATAAAFVWARARHVSDRVVTAR